MESTTTIFQSTAAERIEHDNGGPARAIMETHEEIQEESQSINSSDTDEDTLHRQVTNAMIEDVDREELRRIATALSTRRVSVAGRRPSLVGGPVLLEQVVSFGGSIDASLQPESDQFDLSKWLQYFISQVTAEGITLKKTGICYRNLNVSGTGEAVQLQQTVGNYLMMPLRPGEFFNFGKKTPKKILQNFDGIVKSGELLIVLGRPGAGCSTLLKTMCGEMHGLALDEKSVIHYDGIPRENMVHEFKGEAVYNQEVCD
jgi:hypothetical protein